MLSVKFADGELIQNMPWLSLPNKPIQKIALLINNQKIILQDYEEYNFLREHCYNIIGDGKSQVRAIYLMGRKENKAKVVRLNLLNGEVKELETEIGKEYNGQSCTGWKRGN